MTNNFLVHFPIFRHKNDRINFTSPHSNLSFVVSTKHNWKEMFDFLKFRQNITEKQRKFIDISLKNNLEKSLTSFVTHLNIKYL